LDRAISKAVREHDCHVADDIGEFERKGTNQAIVIVSGKRRQAWMGNKEVKTYGKEKTVSALALPEYQCTCSTLVSVPRCFFN
jgi:hypothetical protein